MKFERPTFTPESVRTNANRETRNNGARIEGICETVMNKLLDARLYTATAPKRQTDRQTGKHVGGWILLSPRARLGKPLSFLYYSPSTSSDLVQRLRRVTRERSSTGELKYRLPCLMFSVLKTRKNDATSKMFLRTSATMSR